MATISIGGEAGNVQYDTVARRVLVAVQNRDEIAVIDPRSNRVARRVPLPGCDHDRGLYVDAPGRLAFDAAFRRLYVAAESGQVAVFADRGHGLRKLGQAMLAPHAHSVAVDPGTHLVHFPLESGAGGRPELLIMAPV